MVLERAHQEGANYDLRCHTSAPRLAHVPTVQTRARGAQEGHPVSTIMSVSGSDPSERRRCDATCHRAKKPNCKCICNGRYHGRGSSEAAQQQLTVDWLGADWRETFAGCDVRLPPGAGQGTLL
jgi:hypothetical protein